MRLATIFLIASMLQVSAATMAQQVTLKKSDVTLKQLFKEIRKQTGYSVVWGSEEFNANKMISVDFNQSSLQEVFSKVITDKGYSYVIDEKTIIIQRDGDVNLNIPIIFTQAMIEVRGKIVDQNGAPLSGASIAEKSNGRGVSTSADGTFIMRNIQEGSVLVIKFIGFDAKEIKAVKEIGIVKMTPATSELDEVQIQAYTQTSKRLSLSNTTTIKAKDIENQIINNPLLALQGRVPGLQIQQLSGSPGSAINLRIQGNSSLVGMSTPFFVVDGVPYSSTTVFGSGNQTVWGRANVSASYVTGNASNLNLNGAGDPLSYLNPNDIESIEVLKDADATAIYGSRAANGAIIITTKKGKAGELKIDLNLQSGWNKAPFGSEFLNTDQYLELRREAFRNSNAVIPATAYDLNGTWDQTRFTDWQKELYKTTNYNNANLSISGGTINSNYRIGGTINRERSPFGANFKNDNAAISVSVNTISANQRFKMTLVANYLNGFNNLPSLGISGGSFVYLLAPNAPNIYNSDGSLNWDIDPTGTISRFRNPLARYLNDFFEVTTNNLTSNLTTSYSILNGLDLKTSFGYNRQDQQEFTSGLKGSWAPTERSLRTISGTFRFNNMQNYIVEPQLVFNRQFAKHRIGVVLGGTYNQGQGETTGMTGSGQSSDSQVRNLAAAASITQAGTNYYESKYVAAFSRLDYNFKDRYILGISGRRDGSARFGPANRFATFWSVAAGWIVSEEFLFKENIKWLNFLKLRANYGLTGNDGIGDYRYMDLYSPNTSNLPYQEIVGLGSRGLFNEGLQWEEKRSLNFGLDARFFNSKITLGVNYNKNRSSNLLQQFTLPSTAGFSNIFVNFDALVQNTGWEFVLGANVHDGKIFSWNLNANLTLLRNKLLSLPEMSRIPFVSGFGYVIDQPLSSAPYFSYMGVNPLTGLEVLEDVNGNPVATLGANSQMKTTLFNSQLSPYYGGLQSSMRLKNFNLTLSFDYTNQLKPRYLYSASSRPGLQPYNQPEVAYQINRWRNPGDIAVVQKYSTVNTSSLLTNSLTIENYVNASYLRLSNVSFSYNIPTKLLSKLGVKSAAIGVNAQNLFIWSGYYGPDPITGANAVVPPMKVIVANIRTSF